LTGNSRILFKHFFLLICEKANMIPRMSIAV
jgi:hypothetical protein